MYIITSSVISTESHEIECELTDIPSRREIRTEAEWMITVKQAATAYRKTNATSLPPLTAVCQALAAIDQQLDESLHHLEHHDERWRDELLQAQQLLFELMAMTDTSSVEGERLLTLYIYANQTLVTASLKADADAMAEVQEIVRSLHADWQHAQRKQMMTTYI